MKTLFFCIFYSIILISIFINDYFLFNSVPVFYIGWLLTIILRYFVGVAIKKNELLTQVIILLIIFPVFINELINSSNHYWHAYIFIILSVNIIYSFPYILSNPKPLFLTSMLWIGLFFVGSIISLINNERAFIVFGPNTLYRIYAFIFISFSIASFQLKKSHYKNILFILTLIMYLISNAATLSRGATIVTFSTLLLLYSHNSKKSWVVIKGSLILLPIYFISFYFVENNAMLQRLFNFNIEGSARHHFLLDTYELALSSRAFGLTSQNNYFLFPEYPHNIFSETIIYSGWYLFLWLIISYTISLLSFLPGEKKTLSYTSLFFLGILIGSLFSGSLFDNFFSFSLGIILMLKKLFKTNTIWI